MKTRKQLTIDNIKISNHMPIDLEKHLDNDTNFLLARILLSNSKKQSTLDRISNNLVFFFWVFMISIGMIILSSVFGLAGLSGL